MRIQRISTISCQHVILDYLVEHVDYDCRQFVVMLYNNPIDHNDSEPVPAEYDEFPKWKPGGN